MINQEYNADIAFSRWRRGLKNHLDEIKGRYFKRKGFHGPQVNLLNNLGDESYLVRHRAINFGQVGWGVFARAYWAIYSQGVNNFYGSVVIGGHPDLVDSPILFEIAEEIRRIRDYDIDLAGIEDFAEIIRDDWSEGNRVKVPESISSGYEVFLQTVRVDRDDLPTGYLHHRLIPIAYSSDQTYAKIVSCRFWGEEFVEIWSSGQPLLTQEELQIYAEAWPETHP